MNMFFRFKVWRKWSKKCINDRWYKILVLLGLRHSPSFTKNYEEQNNEN